MGGFGASMVSQEAPRPSTSEQLQELAEREKRLEQGDAKPILKSESNVLPSSRLATPEARARGLAAKLRAAGEENQAMELEKMANQMEASAQRVAQNRKPQPEGATQLQDKREKRKKRDKVDKSKTEQTNREERARKAEETAQRIMADNERRREALIAERMAELELAGQSPPAVLSHGSSRATPAGLSSLRPPKPVPDPRTAACPKCNMSMKESEVVTHRCAHVATDPLKASKPKCAADLPPVTNLRKSSMNSAAAQQHEPGPLTLRCQADAAAAAAREGEEGERKKKKDRKKRREGDEQSAGHKAGRASSDAVERAKFAAMKERVR